MYYNSSVSSMRNHTAIPAAPPLKRFYRGHRDRGR
jgi:hypothetical protein